jgi:nucleolar protein 58
MARMVATKTALSVRIDALSDADTKSAEDAPIAGIEHRVKLESRLRALEQGMGITSVRRSAVGTSMNQLNGKPSMNGNAGARYNPAADALIPSQPSGSKADESTMETDGDASLLKKSKKDKKRKRDAAAEFTAEAADAELAAPAEGEDVSSFRFVYSRQLPNVLTDMSCWPTPQLDKAERKRRKKEAKLAAAANGLEKKAAAEIGDVSLLSTALGDTTRADESMANGDDGVDEAERKRLKKLRKEEKKAKKASKE